MSESTHSTGRRRYYGWNIVAVLIAMQMAVGSLTFNSFSLFLAGWADSLHARVSELTLAIVALVLFSALAAPIVGALCDKYSVRRLFVIGLLWVAAGFVGISFADAAWQVVAIYGLCAPGVTLCTSTPCNALVSRWFVRRLGLAVGLTTLGLGAGGVLFPPLLAMLLPLVGWRAIFRTVGVIMLLVVVPLVLLIVRDAPSGRERLEYPADAGALANRSAHGRGLDDAGAIGWRQVISRKNFLLLGFIYLSIMGTGSAMQQNIAPFAASRDLNVQTAALLISVMSFSQLLATVGLGLLTDRFGSRRPLAGLAIVVATGLFILICAHDLPLTLLGVALVGTCNGVFAPLGTAISAEFGPRNFGKAFGLALLFLPLSSVLAFGLARVKETTGSHTPMMIGFIGLLILASVVSSFLDLPPTGRVAEEPISSPLAIRGR